mmetsp:Transcript_14231/g.25732  ORF Transcript_14231/g.25732 Transcript_14231/m.25732 type:complete len:409 (-) Transcript_14231:123-1349(-)
MRSNGFERPFHLSQVGTWILLPTLLLQFLLFATPILPLAASIPCTIIVLVCGAATAFFTYKCCSIDPLDARLRRHLARQTGGTEGGPTCGESSPHNGGKEDDHELVKFCWVCGIDVHVSSMHCKFCNKCVENFDHHCHWLNTCVGRANYEWFFRLVGSVLSMELVRGGVLAGLVISFFIQYAGEMNGDSPGGTTLEHSNSWFSADVGLLVAIVNTIFLLVDMGCIVLLVQLFTFHIRLRRDSITTYTYIVNTQQKKRERGREKMDLERRRIAEIHLAEMQGNMVRAWRLKAAGCPHIGEAICRPCDPIRQEETDGDLQMQPQRIERMHNEVNNINNNHTSDGEGNDSPADTKTNGNDTDSSKNEGNDIHIVESDDQSIEVSPLHDAMERKSKSSSHSNGEQNVEFLST